MILRAAGRRLCRRGSAPAAGAKASRGPLCPASQTGPFFSFDVAVQKSTCWPLDVCRPCRPPCPCNSKSRFGHRDYRLVTPSVSRSPLKGSGSFAPSHRLTLASRCRRHPFRVAIGHRPHDSYVDRHPLGCIIPRQRVNRSFDYEIEVVMLLPAMGDSNPGERKEIYG